MEPAVVVTVVLEVLRALAKSGLLSSNDFIGAAAAIADAIARVTGGETVSEVLAQPLRRAQAPDLDRTRSRLLDAIGFSIDGTSPTIPPPRNV